MLQRRTGNNSDIKAGKKKAGNNSDSLINQIRQIVYSSFQSKKLPKKYITT